MKENSFRSWLSNERRNPRGTSLDVRTVGSRLSNCRTVERYEGDLDRHFDQDHLCGLLNPSRTPRRTNAGTDPLVTKFQLTATFYNGTASLRSAVSLYIEFRENWMEGMPILPVANRTRVSAEARKMIVHKDQYCRWIQKHGVGLKDKVASSPDSYISYLNGVSRLLGKDISPAILSTEEDVINIARSIEGHHAPDTIRNYKSAMRQYVAMVRAYATPTDSSAEVTLDEAKDRNIAEFSSPQEVSTASEHNLYSSYREALLEHLFAGEVMRHLWLRGNIRIETLKPQVDDAGYDLVLEANGVVRHVQLKSSHTGSSTADVKVSLDLAKKPSGCLIWDWFDPRTLRLGPFLWFGSQPGLPLPDLSTLKVAKHTKGNAQGVKLQRPNVRVIPNHRFESLATIEELVLKLFGPAREETAV